MRSGQRYGISSPKYLSVQRKPFMHHIYETYQTHWTYNGAIDCLKIVGDRFSRPANASSKWRQLFNWHDASYITQVTICDAKVEWTECFWWDNLCSLFHVGKSLLQLMIHRGSERKIVYEYKAESKGIICNLWVGSCSIAAYQMHNTSYTRLTQWTDEIRSVQTWPHVVPHIISKSFVSIAMLHSNL